MNCQQIVSELSEEHSRAHFSPTLRGKEIFGVDIVILDADAAGLVQAFGCRGELNSKQLVVSKLIVRDLEIVLPALQGEARAYFGRLLRALQAIA